MLVISKYHVFYRRVSTAGQNLAMQASADALYRKKLSPEEVLIIDEDAVSANKKNIKDRPEMQKLISLMKNNQVDTLYVFDHSRLYRDYYEGFESIVDRAKHNVRIVLTKSGVTYEPGESVFEEGIQYVFSDLEGKNIANRTAEARKSYPSKKLGFIKDKKTRRYRKDPGKQTAIQLFFSELPRIQSMEELGELLVRSKKQLGRPEINLVNMVQDPFYAGYDLSKGENKLSHVEPYVDLETFRQIGETAGVFLQEYLARNEQLEQQNTYLPLCGLCNKPLRYKYDVNKNTALYTCSCLRKDERIAISFEDLQQVLQTSLQEVITKLDSDKLVKHSVIQIRELRKRIRSELKVIEHQLEETQEQLLFSSDEYSPDWKENEQYRKVQQLKEEQKDLLKQLADKEKMLANNKKAAHIVKTYFDDNSKTNLSFLSTLFFNKISVHHNEVEIEVPRFDYLKDVNQEIICIGEEII